MARVSRIRKTAAKAAEPMGFDRLAQRAAAEDAQNDAQQHTVDLAEMERLAQEAADQEEADNIDLLEVIREMPDRFDLDVASWNILIEMRRPKNKMGRFVKVESQLTTEQYLTTVGRVLMCGPTALEGRTTSGIDLSHLTRKIKTPEELVGKFVILQRYTGNDLHFAPNPAIKLRLITAGEILAVTSMPGMWMRQ